MRKKSNNDEISRKHDCSAIKGDFTFMLMLKRIKKLIHNLKWAYFKDVRNLTFKLATIRQRPIFLLMAFRLFSKVKESLVLLVMKHFFIRLYFQCSTNVFKCFQTYLYTSPEKTFLSFLIETFLLETTFLIQAVILEFLNFYLDSFFYQFFLLEKMKK